MLFSLQEWRAATCWATHKSIWGCGSLDPSHHSSLLCCHWSTFLRLSPSPSKQALIGLLLFPPYLCCSAPCSPASMGTELIHAWFLAQSEFPDSRRSAILLLVLPIQLPALGHVHHLNDETVWINIRMSHHTRSPLYDVAELFIGSSLRGVTEWRHSSRFDVFLVKIARVLGLLLGLQHNIHFLQCFC